MISPVHSPVSIFGNSDKGSKLILFFQTFFIIFASKSHKNMEKGNLDKPLVGSHSKRLSNYTNHREIIEIIQIWSLILKFSGLK